MQKSMSTKRRYHIEQIHFTKRLGGMFVLIEHPGVSPSGQ